MWPSYQRKQSTRVMESSKVYTTVRPGQNSKWMPKLPLALLCMLQSSYSIFTYGTLGNAAKQSMAHFINLSTSFTF